MKIALVALAGLIPALASAEDPKPYVVYQGHQVRSAPAAAAPAAAPSAGGSGASANTPAARQTSAFGTSSFNATVSPSGSGGSSRAVAGPSSGARSRGFGRASRKRGITGSTGTGAPTSTPATTAAPPAYAVPGAKIISAGQQPVYSDPGNGGTHSVEGGGFIAIDQSKANDVGRAPGITWAPPDAPPSASRTGGGGGSGASANGPAAANGPSNSNSPAIGSNNGNGNDQNGAATANSTGFNPAF